MGERFSFRKLQDVIDKSFSGSEVDEICFDVFGDSDRFYGVQGKPARIVALVNECKKLGKVYELLDVIKAKRDNITRLALSGFFALDDSSQDFENPILQHAFDLLTDQNYHEVVQLLKSSHFEGADEAERYLFLALAVWNIDDREDTICGLVEGYLRSTRYSNDARLFGLLALGVIKYDFYTQSYLPDDKPPFLSEIQAELNYRDIPSRFQPLLFCLHPTEAAKRYFCRVAWPASQ